MGAKFDKVKCGAMLRQSQSRINIHRSKKLSGVAKKKDDICKHLESGNEVNAKIWAETLINEEGLIPVYDVVSTMCDQVNGRLTQIQKFGAPKDMNNTFATIIHAAPKIDVKELITVRQQLSAILAPEFVRECDTNYDLLNPVVAQNIDFRKPEDGEVVLRMVNLAKERNIDYTPTHESCQSLHAYCLRKGIPPPEGVGGPDGPVPQYVPQPQMVDFNAMAQNQGPPAGGFPAGGPPGGMPPQMPPQMPPPGMPPSGGMPAPQAYPGMDVPPPAGTAMPPPYQPQGGPPTTMPAPGYMPDMTQQPPQQPGPGPDAAGGAGGAEESFEERLARLKNM